jgi:hypothetical protein
LLVSLLYPRTSHLPLRTSTSDFHSQDGSSLKNFGSLFLTSIVITVFVGLHLKTFKWGAYYEVGGGAVSCPSPHKKTPPQAPSQQPPPPRPRFQTKTEDGTTVRDLYRLELEVFQDPKMVRDRHREQYLLTIK